MNQEQRQILTLSRRGVSRKDIAAHMEMAASKVNKFLDNVISQELDQERVKEAFNAETQRLEDLYGEWNKHAFESMNEDGEIVPPSMEAAKLLLQIHDRTVKLFGLAEADKMQAQKGEKTFVFNFGPREPQTKVIEHE